MARASTMKCLFHHAPFISCVVFLLVTLKFLRSCFDNTKKKKERESRSSGRFVCPGLGKQGKLDHLTPCYYFLVLMDNTF